MRLSKKLLLSFCLCFGFVEAAAQYRIDHWTADDGLPLNSIYSVIQTQDGYLWMATLDGLVRFDGVRFTIFNKFNSPGIINNRFVNLYEDAQKDLWALTEKNGAVRFHQGRFSSYGESAGIIPPYVYWFGNDANGNVTILPEQGAAIRFADGKFSHFDGALEFSQGAGDFRQKSNIIYCSLEDFVNGQNHERACFVNGQRWMIPLTGVFKDDRLRTAAQDKNGSVWVITEKEKLVRVENGKVVRIFGAADGLKKHPTNFLLGLKLYLVSLDEEGSLWLTDLETMRNELLLRKSDNLPRETGDFFTAYYEGETPAQIPFWGAEKSFQDSEGNFWFGTWRNGLYRARKQTVTAFSTAEGLSERNVYPIYEDDADGTIWVGTTNGLFIFQNGRFKRIEGTEKFSVTAIGKDSAGRIVICDFPRLYVWDHNRFIPFLQDETSKLPVYGSAIFAVHTDRENSMWLGGERGLIRYKDGSVTRFTSADGLAGNDVKVIIEAKAGGLWIGTYEGLSRYQNGQLTSWTENEGLPGGAIRALYEEADGTLWIGTYDSGLARFKDGKFTRFNTSNGLYNDGAFQILEDERRNFWISSNRGIYRVNKDELNEYADGKRAGVTSIAYGKSDGMRNIECNGGRSPAGFKARDGRLWFPTQDGVAVIDPKEVKVNSQPPPVVIESVKIDNELSAETGLALDQEKSAIPLQIEPSQQNFEINYTALSFINSENIRFKYRLEGLEADWIDAGTRRTAYYSYVPPGEYTFHVIAANSDNVWNEIGASVKVIVKPPFYRTWIFILACAALVLFIIYAVYRRRVHQLEHARAMQEEFSRRLINAHEAERSRVAAELHDSIGQTLAMIKNRAVFGAQMIDNPEAKEQLEAITSQTTQAIGEVREISYNLRPYLLENLGLTRAIKSLVGKIEEFHLLTINSRIDDVDNLFSAEAEMSVYRIVQESLNNVAKHSDADEAWLTIEKTGGIITIKIGDDGCGFDKNAAPKTDVAKGGFGLLGIAERVRMLGGSLDIQTGKGKGTKLTIKIIAKDKIIKER